MAKSTDQINAQEILERMRVNSKFETMSELAGFLRLSPQALNNALKRNSISLQLVLLYCAKTCESIEYVLYGIRSYNINVKHVLDPDVCLSIPETWFNDLGTKPFDTKFFTDSNGKSFLIDASVTGKKPANGTYAILAGSSVAIFGIKIRFDGSIVIEGEDQAIPADQVNKINILGKVIWKCEKV
jgi:hypothetical protein